MNFTITIEGAKELKHSFDYVEQRLVDFRQLGTWKAVAREFYKIIKAQFDSEGGSGRSGKWAPLTPKYAAIKAKKYPGGSILVATGALRASLTSGGPNAIYEESSQELTIGTKDQKAGFHQYGRKKREIFSFTDEQNKQTVEPIYQKLNQLIANAKLRDIRGF